MLTEERRKEIIKILKNNEEPITGTELAKKFKVSRQVIVQDIAVMRAKGYNIIATSNGYMISKLNGKKKNIKTIVCRHEGYSNMEEELKIMVDMGARVLDVIIEHPIYGDIRSTLMIDSRMDLEDFMEKVKNNKAAPLASLTGGEHIHTIEIPNDRAYKKIIKELKEKGYLIKGE
ncbi:transcription repressor NadR [Crassaminicella thermophila]|uniref:Transcription repressor NadR n=1 Tax=Crassaminicella thermophila TaxID=2599308 RepID=A0A5C0SA88_CRATE|nr:transcription repressor NadR [Crassaminicella thermophila]QEK10910.1 transcription repressor NadR [Crassaminicella thermophila]